MESGGALQSCLFVCLFVCCFLRRPPGSGGGKVSSLIINRGEILGKVSFPLPDRDTACCVGCYSRPLAGRSSDEL